MSLSSNSIVIGMEGDENGLVHSFDTVNKAEERLVDKTKKLADAQKKSGKAAKEMARDAQQAYDKTRTPQEQYAARLKRLSSLYKANKIDIDTWKRAAAQAKQKMVADTRKLESATKDAGIANKAAFGKGALADVAKLAGGYLSVATAIRTATTALTEMEAVRKEAAEKARESVFDLGELAQVADSPKEFKQLTGKARRLYGTGGAESLSEAGQVIFALKSAGSMDQLDLFGDMKRSRLVRDPAKMAKAAKTLLASMGEEETGGTRALVSKAFGASAFSPAKAEALLEAAARSGGSARALGFTDEAVLAATAISATTSGSAELGGTRVASFMRSLDKQKGFRGTSLRESVLKIKEMGLEGEELQKFLGRQEAVQGYRDILNNLETFDTAVAAIKKSEATDEVGRRLKYYKADPSVASATAAMRAKAREEVSRTALGTASNVADTMQSNFAARRREAGGWETGTWISNKGDSLYRWMFGDEAYIKSMRQYASPDTKRLIDTRSGDPGEQRVVEATRRAVDELSESPVVAILKMIEQNTATTVRQGDQQVAQRQDPAVNHGDRE